MILEWEDGTSGMPPTCFLVPMAQPSALSSHALKARAGEHNLEHDGRHAPAGGVFIFNFGYFNQDIAEILRDITEINMRLMTDYEVLMKL